MLKFVDYYLDRITMYRLLLYYLILIVAIAIAVSFFGVLPYSPFDIVFSVLFILGACWVIHSIFVVVFDATSNVESVYITALILALILTPTSSFEHIGFLFWCSVWASASKFIFAIKKKHVFNPVAIAAVIVPLGISESPNWWISNAWLLPVVFFGGLLITRKIRRFDLVLSFFITTITVSFVLALLKGSDLSSFFTHAVLHSPLFFFAFIMLTEPLTTPPYRWQRIVYGALVGLLFSPQVHIGSLYFAPELALVMGNVFSYLVSPKDKLVLYLHKKQFAADGVMDFFFKPSRHFNFIPGQYMEWTLGHDKPDNRGNRRYFTIASAPEENLVRIGVKFYPESSSYKRALMNLNATTPIVASQIAGQFTLPKNTSIPCVLIAGGIGVTPFRSMVAHALAVHEKRPLTLLYSVKHEREVAYRDLFEEARQHIGLQVHYVVTGTGKHSIDASFISSLITNYADCLYFVSGPHDMVVGISKTLKSLGISRDRIKTDYFPGLA